MMITDKEFEELWQKDERVIKKIRLDNGGVVYAMDYYNKDDNIKFSMDGWVIGVFNFKNIKGIED